MGIFSCDYEDCSRKPYVECFDDKEKNWWYFCRWHYFWMRMKREFRKNEHMNVIEVDTLRGVVEGLKYDIWDIQNDLKAIKEKLKIKEKKEFPEEKPEEKGFA